MTADNDALAGMVEATRRLRAAFAGADDASRHLHRHMAIARRRLLRVAYRTGFLPWPIPKSCYPHRTRWAGRAPQRRRRR